MIRWIRKRTVKMLSWQFLKNQFELGATKFPLLQHIIIEIPEKKQRKWNKSNPMPGAEADRLLKHFAEITQYWSSDFIYRVTPKTMMMDMICEAKDRSLNRPEAFYQFKSLATKAGELYGTFEQIKVADYNCFHLWLFAVHQMAKPERRVFEGPYDIFSRRAKPGEVCYAVIDDLFFESAFLCDKLAKQNQPQENLINPSTLTDTESNILEALRNDTLRGAELLKKAGYDNSSHYRTILSNLVKRTILGRNSNGYYTIVRDKRQD